MKPFKYQDGHLLCIHFNRYIYTYYVNQTLRTTKHKTKRILVTKYNYPTIQFFQPLTQNLECGTQSLPLISKQSNI